MVGPEAVEEQPDLTRMGLEEGVETPQTPLLHLRLPRPHEWQTEGREELRLEGAVAAGGR